MVHLTYVENPFERNTFEALSNFAYEKSFYDCVNRKFLDESFQNLEYTFYMYMLTGDNNEWIGYVLFSNEMLVKGSRYFSYKFVINSLESINKIYNSDEILQMIQELEQNKDCAIIFEVIENIFDKLENIMDKSSVDSFRNRFHNNFDLYLKEQCEFYNLDVVISLPLNERTEMRMENNDLSNINILVEQKYYGFIRETLKLVEDLINRDYSGKQIFLRKDNEIVFMINSSTILNKKLINVL